MHIVRVSLNCLIVICKEHLSHIETINIPMNLNHSPITLIFSTTTDDPFNILEIVYYIFKLLKYF